MLEKIREGSQGFWAKAILGLVCITFALAGVGSYLNTRGEEPVATVNGVKIGKAAFDKAMQNERSQQEAQYGERYADMAAQPGYMKQLRQSVLNRLIADNLFQQLSKEMGLRVSDEQIKKQVLGMKEFQLDGKFNNDRYLSVLRQIGFQPTDFRDYMRKDLTRQQVLQALIGTEFALKSEAAQVHAIQNQTRDVRYLTVPGKLFADNIKITDEELNNYYQAHLSQFDTAEKVSLDYVDLQADDLTAGIKPTEQQLQQYYQDNLSKYRVDGQRKVAHILIEFGKDDAKAKAKAEAILKQLKNGADFATLAKKDSADIASADDGGVLDWFKKGERDPAFEAAAFALTKPGQLSGVVKSAFGYHILKLVDLKKEQISPLSEVHDQVANAYKHDKAVDKIYALQQKMADAAFENPDNLDKVAEIVGKKVKTTALFDKDHPPAMFNKPAIVTSAFSDELVEQGVNSDVQEVGENHFVVFRVHEHKPVRTKALTEVKTDIHKILMAEKTREAAKKWADDLLVKINKEQNISDQLTAKKIDWQEQKGMARFGAKVAPQISTEAFKLAAKGSASRAVVSLANGDAAIIEVQAIHSAKKADDKVLAGLQQRLAQLKVRQEMGWFIDALRAQADIEVSKTL